MGDLEETAFDWAANFEHLKSEECASGLADLVVALNKQMADKSLDQAKRYLDHLREEDPDADWSEFEELDERAPDPYPLAVFVEVLVGVVQERLLFAQESEGDEEDPLKELVEALSNALSSLALCMAGRFESLEQARAEKEHWDQRQEMHLLLAGDDS